VPDRSACQQDVSGLHDLGSREGENSRSEVRVSGRLYRVVKRLPWIEGGRPAPGLRWEGGEAVVYEPGDTVYVDDQELAEVYHKLEGIDDASRAALEGLRAQEGAHITDVADISSDDAEFLARALRREDNWEWIERTYATARDDTKQLLSTKVRPANLLPGVAYNGHGVPLPWTTALRNERWEMESKLARIKSGGSWGRVKGRETKRDKAARPDEALLAAVLAYRLEHPSHGRPAIAAAFVDEYGRQIDHADPKDRGRAIAALVKRIERLERK
jgi:hypothetical protein